MDVIKLDENVEEKSLYIFANWFIRIGPAGKILFDSFDRSKTIQIWACDDILGIF